MSNNKVDLGELFFKQRGLCYWCKCPMDLDGYGLRAATREHLIPQSAGGRNYVRIKGNKRARNVVAACVGCNAKRGNMDVEAFRALMRSEVGKDVR